MVEDEQRSGSLRVKVLPLSEEEEETSERRANDPNNDDGKPNAHTPKSVSGSPALNFKISFKSNSSIFEIFAEIQAESLLSEGWVEKEENSDRGDNNASLPKAGVVISDK